MASEPLHLDFSSAEEQRNRISQEQAQSIRDMYRQASEEIGRMAERAPRVPSDALRKEYLNKLQGQINRELQDIQSQLDGTVRSSMLDTVQEVVRDASNFANGFGLSIEGAYSHVPTDVVRAVMSGQLYEGNWTLSKALWLNTKETQQDVQNIVAKGILENKSAYDIAKDLEKYVNPDARKDWEWSKVYPGTRKVVDYNAQRLARTMVSHAYQQAFVRTTIKNPFITKYEWRAADTERTCQLCLDRDGQYFPKDDLPLDHPNGMCTFLAVIEDDFNTIADRLADWAHGGEDPALDEWAKDLYGKDWQAKKEQAQTNQDKAKASMPVKNYKDLQQKWGVTCSKALGDRCVQNLDEALTYMTNTYGYEFLSATPLFDNKNPLYLRGYEAYYSSWEDSLGIHVHKDNSKRLETSIWVHELGHALTGYIAAVQKGRHSFLTEVCDSVTATAFTNTGHQLNKKGVPTNKDMAICVSQYGGTNTAECVAEAVRNVWDHPDSTSKESWAIHEELLRLLGR